MNLLQVSILSGSLVLALNSWAAPGTLTYQGRIRDSQGTPLEVNGVRFEFSILNPTGTCILYRETSGSLDMRNSQGVFESAIGTGTKNFPTSSTFKLLDSFDNSATLLNCEGGGTYSPVADDKRFLRVQFYDGTGWKLITPDSEIRSVPFAGYANTALTAQKLGVFSPTDFLVKTGIPLCSPGEYLRHIAPLGTFECTVPSVNGADVSGNIPGSAAGFTGSLAGDVSGTQSATTVNKIKGVAVDMTGLGAGKILKYDGAKWAPADESGGSGSVPNLTGDVTSTSGAANTKVAKIQGTSVSTTTPQDGQVFVYGSSSWAPQFFGFGDLRSSVTGNTQVPSSCSTPDKTLTWNTVTDSFSCSAISITKSQISDLGGSGSIQLAMDSGTCDGSKAGTIRYNPSNKKIEYCNEVAWIPIESDLSPNALSFTNLSYQDVNSYVYSEQLLVSGISSTANVVVTGTGSPEVSVNGGPWSSTTTVDNGQTIQMRLHTSASTGTTATATLTIGTYSAPTWTVTTYNTMYAISAAAQSSVYGGLDSASVANMTDSDGSTGTGTGSSPDEWISIDLGSSQSVNFVRVGGGNLNGWGGVAGYLNNREIQYSTDGSSWTTITTVTGVNDIPPSQFVHIAFPAVTARFIRIHSNGWLATTELGAGN